MAKGRYELREGEVVDNYRILSSLGQGGMGKVYLCEHIVLQKRYALKILTVAGDSDVHWRRFQAEARAISKLNHINIVRVHNMGVYQNELPYYVMDVLTGETLKEKITREGPLSEQQTVEIYLAVSAGLDYAHRSEIVHRDIKPSNIMLVKDDHNQEIVKLVDFGLVKTIGETQGMTATGEILGSPYYMSPEQAAGQRVSYGSDLYSVGISMFETLTGTVPFKGQNAMQTILLHAQKPAPSLKSAAPAQQFTTACESVVACLLQKNAADRYMTTAELKDDLLSIKRTRDLAPRSPARQASTGPASTTSTSFFSKSTSNSSEFNTRSELNTDSNFDTRSDIATGSDFETRSESGADNSVTANATRSGSSNTTSTTTTGDTTSFYDHKGKIIAFTVAAVIALVSTIIFVIAMVNAPSPPSESSGNDSSIIEDAAKSSTMEPDRSVFINNQKLATADLSFSQKQDKIGANTRAQVKPYFVRREGKNRLFKFPERHNLGVFFLSAGGVVWSIDEDPRGFIVVPDNTDLVLMASNALHADLDLLKGFGPTDLGGANLSNCVSHISALLQNLAPLKSINYIDLSKTDVVDSEIALLDQFPALTVLKVNVTNLNPQTLAGWKGFNKLTTFEYKDCARPMEMVNLMVGHKKLLQFAINNSKIPDGLCSKFAGMPALRLLLISSCNLTASQIGELTRAKQLTKLVMRKQLIGTESIDDLRKIGATCDIEITRQPGWKIRDSQRLVAGRPRIRIIQESAGHGLETHAQTIKQNDWLSP